MHKPSAIHPAVSAVVDHILKTTGEVRAKYAQLLKKKPEPKLSAKAAKVQAIVRGDGNEQHPFGCNTKAVCAVMSALLGETITAPDRIRFQDQWVEGLAIIEKDVDKPALVVSLGPTLHWRPKPGAKTPAHAYGSVRKRGMWVTSNPEEIEFASVEQIKALALCMTPEQAKLLAAHLLPL